VLHGEAVNYMRNLNAEEIKTTLLADVNNTKVEYPKQMLIHQLFEQQVEKDAEHTALIFEKDKLTYQELNIRANQLARSLRNKGIRADSIVGIMVERSVEMIVGILAILKAGGAYMPIDPTVPQSRIAYMLEDSKASIIVTQTQFIEHIQFYGDVLDLNDTSIYALEEHNLSPISAPHNLAYVIYTSGSTGNPKGVMIEHRSVINRLTWMQRQYPLDPHDVILQKTPYTFDVSVWELLWWSMTGAVMCVLTPKGEKDPSEVVRAIHEYKITTIHFVPSMLNMFLEYVDLGYSDQCRSLKRVFASGEALHVNHVQKFYDLFNADSKTLINLYGPTEATVDVTYYNCSPEDAALKMVPIGKPIDNIQIYIVNELHQLTNLEEVGELCIAGDGLARGYLNRPDLTAEKFVGHSFTPEGRMYKTGDLARWSADGMIEYLGRKDDQVKIKGYRIELGEIESQLRLLDGVREAAVAVKEAETGSPLLVAYYTGVEQLTTEDMKQQLSLMLPEYMVPVFWVRLESMPLTANGKLDRKILPDNYRKQSANSVPYAEPVSQTEQVLVNIWSEVLNRDAVGVNDNFFECGGDSIKSTMIVTRIIRHFGIEIQISMLFNLPTIKQLGEYIDSMEQEYFEPIEALSEQPFYEVSAAQKRIYILDQADQFDVAWNMPGWIDLKGTLDRGKLQNAMNLLVERHEAFRTSFEVMGGDLKQIVHDKTKLTMNIQRAKDEQEADSIIKQWIKPFAMDQAPLLRVGVITLTEQRHRLFFDFHHIIFDGVSVGIFLKELMKLYDGYSLDTLKLQYRDFAVWQNKRFERGQLQLHQSYWLETFSKPPEPLNLPTDRDRQLQNQTSGKQHIVTINRSLTASLKALSVQSQASLFMILLAGYNILLSKYTGKEDITVGSFVAGRVGPVDIERMIGMFANTLPLRHYPDKMKTFMNFLGEVKHNVLNALAYQEYPLANLKQRIQEKHGFREALFETLFTMQNMEQPTIKTQDFSGELHEVDIQWTAFSIALQGVEMESKEVQLNVQFNPQQFNDETIHQLFNHYVELLKQIVEDPDTLLKDFELGQLKIQRNAVQMDDIDFDF
jgi:amino acid adenylation domain-containing protein